MPEHNKRLFYQALPQTPTRIAEALVVQNCDTKNANYIPILSKTI